MNNTIKFKSFNFILHHSCETEIGDEKDVMKTVQKCLNRSIAN